ncbi:MAG TPA: phage Gp37/Gp68 family protein [Bacteroidota bacterium]|nr:phage Gp37/Gp68 family protein [Bacteroidota bacterium]
MSAKSPIEWTDSTWNPVTGCTKISPGCKHCYAETFAERFRGVPGHPYEQGFDLKLWPERLKMPLRWKEPKMIFVNSMSDLFHEKVPDEFVRKIFDVMVKADQHIFQVLTKRSERLMAWTRENYRFINEKINGRQRLPKNIWLGVSVENQEYTSRIVHLQKVPARIRFLSIEPLLGPVKLTAAMLRGIHWVIVGGESGPGARPMEKAWVDSIRLQCKAYYVPFFFKQWGKPQFNNNPSDPTIGKEHPHHAKGGCQLDGQVFRELPAHVC